VTNGEAEMKFPIRNCSSGPLTLFIEPQCDEYKVAPGGEAVVTPANGLVGSGYVGSIEIHNDREVTVWIEGGDCKVEVLSIHQSVGV
jgi:hypothetical protein